MCILNVQRTSFPPFVCGSNRSIGRSAARNKKGKRKKRSRLRVTSPSAARKTRISRDGTTYAPLAARVATAANCRYWPSETLGALRSSPLLSSSSLVVRPRHRAVECCFSPFPLSSSVHTDATSRHATSLAAPALRVYSNYSLSPSLAFDGYFSVLTRGYFSVRTLDTGPRTPDQRPSVRTLRIRAREECKVRKRKSNSKQSKYWFFVCFCFGYFTDPQKRLVGM